MQCPLASASRFRGTGRSPYVWFDKACGWVAVTSVFFFLCHPLDHLGESLCESMQHLHTCPPLVCKIVGETKRTKYRPWGYESKLDSPKSRQFNAQTYCTEIYGLRIYWIFIHAMAALFCFPTGFPTCRPGPGFDQWTQVLTKARSKPIFEVCQFFCVLVLEVEGPMET